jgi:hypothetical protein
MVTAGTQAYRVVRISLVSPAEAILSPRRSAPPIMQQSVPPVQEEEVVWDESMMDVDDEFQDYSHPSAGQVVEAKAQQEEVAVGLSATFLLLIVS